MPSPHAGVIDSRAMRMVERARSPRNGRMVATSTALAEYRTSLDSIPVREEAMHGGMWDYEAEAAMGPRRGPPRAKRVDAEALAAYVAGHSHRMTGTELDVYALFWVQGLSYKQVADRIGWSDQGRERGRDRVYQLIKRIRVKAHGARLTLVP
jgi:hypothetical protein